MPAARERESVAKKILIISLLFSVLPRPFQKNETMKATNSVKFTKMPKLTWAEASVRAFDVVR